MNQHWRRVNITLALFLLGGAVAVVAICALIAILPGCIHSGNPVKVFQDLWFDPQGGGRLLLAFFFVAAGAHPALWYLRRTRRRRQVASHRVVE